MIRYACLFCRVESDSAITKPAGRHSDEQKLCVKCGARFYPPARKKGAYSRTGATVSELRLSRADAPYADDRRLTSAEAPASVGISTQERVA